jgi:hypothetical protein
MSQSTTGTEALIKSMRASVAKALDRKRRLSQYAVVWKNDQIVRIDPEDIKPLAPAEEQAPYNQPHTNIK